MSASIVNRRKFLDAAHALVRTSDPDVKQIQTTIEALATVLSDLSDTRVRLVLSHAKGRTMTLTQTQADLLPCPFCGVRLSSEIDDGANFHIHPKNDCFFSEYEYDQLNVEQWNRRAATASISPAMLEGFVLAPKKPTEQMMLAAVERAPCIIREYYARDGKYTGTVTSLNNEMFGEAYTAMLAAAPQLPASTESAVQVPVSAYLWLMGMDDDGFIEDRRGAYWWRSAFNERAGLDMMEIHKASKLASQTAPAEPMPSTASEDELPPLPECTALSLTSPNSKKVIECLWIATAYSSNKEALFTTDQMYDYARAAQHLRWCAEVNADGLHEENAELRAALAKPSTIASAENSQDQPHVPPPTLNSTQQFWLDNRAKIIAAIQSEGFTLMSNQHGFYLAKLGKAEAQGDQQ